MAIWLSFKPDPQIPANQISSPPLLWLITTLLQISSQKPSSDKLKPLWLENYQKYWKSTSKKISEHYPSLRANLFYKSGMAKSWWDIWRKGFKKRSQEECNKVINGADQTLDRVEHGRFGGFHASVSRGDEERFPWAKDRINEKLVEASFIGVSLSIRRRSIVNRWSLSLNPTYYYIHNEQILLCVLTVYKLKILRGVWSSHFPNKPYKHDLFSETNSMNNQTPPMNNNTDQHSPLQSPVEEALSSAAPLNKTGVSSPGSKKQKEIRKVTINMKTPLEQISEVKENTTHLKETSLSSKTKEQTGVITRCFWKTLYTLCSCTVYEFQFALKYKKSNCYCRHSSCLVTNLNNCDFIFLFNGIHKNNMSIQIHCFEHCIADIKAVNNNIEGKYRKPSSWLSKWTNSCLAKEVYNSVRESHDLDLNNKMENCAVIITVISTPPEFYLTLFLNASFLDCTGVMTGIHAGHQH